MQNNRVALLRNEKGLTQEDLSRALQITRSSVSHYESGRREPDMATLDRMADYFDCSVDYLIGRTTFRTRMADLENMHLLDGLDEEDALYVTQLVERLKRNKMK